MKKCFYGIVLFGVAIAFASCAVGSYVPSTLNVGGTSTQVVLSQANYRVVRNVEAVIEINNDNLRRADVEKSAFAELTRRYPLTGSQAYINVVLEEIRREKFGMGGGLQGRKQFVAVRATIIEFLQANGQPVASVESEYNTVSPQSSQSDTKQSVQTESKHTVEQNASRPTDMESLAKYPENQAYIMLLIKTNMLEKQMINEVQKYFDLEALKKEKVQYSTPRLQEMSEQHDKIFEKFSK